VVEIATKYWQKLWEMEKRSLLRDTLKQQSAEKGDNWLNKIEQEP
jgi:hypothetical protein